MLVVLGRALIRQVGRRLMGSRRCRSNESPTQLVDRPMLGHTLNHQVGRRLGNNRRRSNESPTQLVDRNLVVGRATSHQVGRRLEVSRRR